MRFCLLALLIGDAFDSIRKLSFECMDVPVIVWGGFISVLSYLVLRATLYKSTGFRARKL